ncbi:MAG: hypothetical protein JKY51_00075 [Opitutaceae bacterium]|nr:hypothetical protein [Opitutaceae bacterium]MBL4893330.1 hypothetical protein [Emcibacter sp.]
MEDKEKITLELLCAADEIDSGEITPLNFEKMMADIDVQLGQRDALA